MRLSVVSRGHPALTLPDIPTARAGDRLCGMFLFHEFLTNGTGSLPHIQTWLSCYKGRLRRQGYRAMVRRSVPFCTDAPFSTGSSVQSLDLPPDVIQS